MSLKQTAAWKWFALFIKERDHWICVTCGKRARGFEMGAGHFIQAFGHLATYFDEQNVHAQCSSCNCWGNTTVLEYRRAINRKYGPGTDLKLEKKGREKRERFSAKELTEISITYRRKYRELCQISTD